MARVTSLLLHRIMSEAKVERLLLVNPDTITEKYTIKELSECAQKEKSGIR